MSIKMKYVLALVFFVVSMVLSSDRDGRFMLIVGIATVLGFVLGKLFDLQKELQSLRTALSKDWEERNATKSEEYYKIQNTPVTNASNLQSNQEQIEGTGSLTNIDDSHGEAHPPTFTSPSKESGAPAQAKVWGTNTSVIDKKVASEKALSGGETQATQKVAPVDSLRVEGSLSVKNSQSAKGSQSVKDSLPAIESSFDSAFDKAGNVIKGYFTGGNLFVRIGIIILFFGVSFLLKYVSDQGFFPIEYRLIGVVIGAIALLGLGWRLRLKNETYALLLQGAGIGVLYLDIYAAFSLYDLLAPMAAFGLLFVVSMFSAALAVLQDSKSLAVLGFSGGFLAPVLASSGSNNHVGLFSYYALLNLAIVAVAWFKAWRPLNLLGFAFTFIIGTVWGVTSYDSAKFATTEPFLILFFLFYVLIAVLFALRQPPKLRGYVDGTLLFGVPLAASGLQYSLVQNFEYGVSLSSFAMGAFYLVLSWFIWKRKGDDLKLLAEAFLALGVIFASMAIPFALAPTQTAAAWALEGAGLLWLGSRQNRLSVRAFGLLLQVGAGMAFLSNFNVFSNHASDAVSNIKPFINGEFFSSMMLAIAGIFSARLLFKSFKGRQSWEDGFSPIILAWGLIWLFGGFVNQLGSYYPMDFFKTNLLLFTAGISLLFTLFGMKSKPAWSHAWMVATGLFGLVLLLAFTQFGYSKYELDFHLLQYNGWIAWTVVFAVYYFLLKQLEKHQVLQRIQPIIHSLLLLLLVILVTVEGAWLLKKQLSSGSDWMGIWYIVPSIVALWMIIKAKFWPFSSHKETYRQQTGIALAAAMSIWSLFALGSEGTSDPLPWIPLLNPLDIVSVIIFITLFKWWQASSDSFGVLNHQSAQNKSFNKRVFSIGIAGLVFLWLNVTLFRMAHHWFGIDYNGAALYNSGLVQTSVSILWALSGVILTVYASRKMIRFLWMAGAVVLGLVVLKLFVIDLSTLGNLSRIISFLVVGILLTSIGYFAPLPDNTLDEEDVETEGRGKNENEKNA